MVLASESWHTGSSTLSVSCLVLNKEWIRTLGDLSWYRRCLLFHSVFLCYWLADRKDIGPYKICPVISRDSLLEHVNEED